MIKKIRKRYLLLIVLALFPFYRFIHTDNYCFGDVDLVIMAGFTIIYIIAFISILFYNLYKIALKKELFNFRPLIITLVFSTTLFYTIEYHDQNLFKEKVQVFRSYTKQKEKLEISLFKNKTFELRTIDSTFFCVEKGIYEYKNDTLFLNKSNNIDGNIVFGDVYVFDSKFQSLNPIYSGLPIFVLEK